MVLTVVDVDGAVLALKTRKTLASVISIVINTASIIFTRVKLLSTKGNFPFTVVSHVSGGAFALIGVDKVDAGGIVLALVVNAVVNVVFTAHPGKPRLAEAAIDFINIINTVPLFLYNNFYT